MCTAGALRTATPKRAPPAPGRGCSCTACTRRLKGCVLLPGEGTCWIRCVYLCLVVAVLSRPRLKQGKSLASLLVHLVPRSVAFVLLFPWGLMVPLSVCWELLPEMLRSKTPSPIPNRSQPTAYPAALSPAASCAHCSRLQATASVCLRSRAILCGGGFQR